MARTGPSSPPLGGLGKYFKEAFLRYNNYCFSALMLSPENSFVAIPSLILLSFS
jgi:hypothetical protein